MRIYLTQLFLVASLITGVAVLFFFNPESVAYPPCFFKKITGLQCPGCGSARACYHLLHGHFLTAVDYNLLLTAFLPILTIEGISKLFSFHGSVASKLQVVKNHIRPAYVLFVVLMFWIVRNLPLYPFTLLSSDH